MKKEIIATIAFALFGTAVSAPLHAQDGNVRTIAVSFADLDVTDSQDMYRLRTRIDNAVRRLCPARIQGPVRIYSDHRECRAESWEDAERQLSEFNERILAGETVPTSLAIRMSPEPRS